MYHNRKTPGLNTLDNAGQFFDIVNRVLQAVDIAIVPAHASKVQSTMGRL